MENTASEKGGTMAPTAKKATVIVPHWNGREVLAECLHSLSRQHFRDFQTIVVDNGSTDGSCDFIAERFPHVEVVALPENRGFGGAVNEGIRRSRTSYVALLNNDCLAAPGWLGSLVDALESGSEWSFCSCKILNYFNRTSIAELGHAYCRDGSVVQIGAGMKDTGTLDMLVNEVFGPSGAAALYRKSLFDDTGLFDDDLFLYFEDVDLSIRARLSGHRCRYVPSGVVYHRGGYSTGRIAGIQKYFVANKVRVFIKNMPRELLSPYLPRLIESLGEDFRWLESRGAAGLYREGIALALSDLEHFIKKASLQEIKVPAGEFENMLGEREDYSHLTLQQRIPFLPSQSSDGVTFHGTGKA
ncbi:MAG: glycosyltransferase family 2 protein [Candidatus Eremiobacteraeota bacterium]|nr:glycosyltransferase family 2 protein [Candidatus Eremiobacteraeota bacterium]